MKLPLFNTGKKKQKKKRKEVEKEPSVAEETKKGVLAIAFFVVALVLLLAAFNQAGMVGEIIHTNVEGFLGLGYFVLPILLIIFSVMILQAKKPMFSALNITSFVVLLISALGIIDIVFGQNNSGYFGNLIGESFVRFFDAPASLLIFLAAGLTSVLLIFDSKLKMPEFKFNLNMPIFRRKDEEEEKEEIEESAEEVEPEPEEEIEPTGEEPAETKEEKTKENPEDPSAAEKFMGMLGGKKKEAQMAELDNYTPPPISLLSSKKSKPEVGDIKASTNIIKRTLKNFGIEVEMAEVSVGSTVTRYAFKPAEGVKLSRIVGLQNDLGLALAAHPIRIEAPIPGKSLVGIEVPNKTKSKVNLASMLKDEKFSKTVDPLTVALGKGVSGQPHFTNLAKLPHLLIGGATGAGKSVTVHSIITSLLYRKGPLDLRFIMIDPKRVELTLYNKTPHLLTPVITDPKKAILALKWAAKEMDRRYDVLEAETVRDITSYHKNVVAPAFKKVNKKKELTDEEKNNLPERMPYIVIIIDELADIMTTYPRELESAIVRLAQMSRAVGIHLILSTQRPSVNVITGLIKANVPARIALQVASQVDSRTILDSGGAEKLLGAGDMLFSSGEMARPTRIQSSFISEDEVKKVVNHLAKSSEDQELLDEISFSEKEDKADKTIFESVLDEEQEVNEEEDELYEQARELVISAGKGSTSYLQRRLKVGYSRAARLIDDLEEKGVLGPAEGSKPRKVIVEKPEEE